MFHAKRRAFILAAVMAASVSAPASALPVMAQPVQTISESSSETSSAPVSIENSFESTSGADAEEKAEKVIIPGLERDGYTLKYWSNKPDGSGRKYHVGDTYVVGSDPMLYAVWEKDEEEPAEPEASETEEENDSAVTNENVAETKTDSQETPAENTSDEEEPQEVSYAPYEGSLTIKRGDWTFDDDSSLVLTCKAGEDIDVSAKHQDIKAVVDWDESVYSLDVTTSVADSGNNDKAVELDGGSVLNLESGKYVYISYRMTLRNYHTGETAAVRTVSVKYQAE